MALAADTARLLRGRLLQATHAFALSALPIANLDCTQPAASRQSSAAAAEDTKGPSPARQEAEEKYKHQDGFEFIATSMRKCLSHLGPWSIGDLAFGVKALADSHEDLAESVEGTPITDLQLLRDLHEQVRIADAIYEPNVTRVVGLCSLRREDVVRFVADGDRMRPAYCIAVRPDRRQVILVIRGTKSLGDAVTILTGSSAEFQGGHTHAGMLHSAHWLLHNETTTLRRLLEENRGYSLRLIGHSLGAGAAALYTMILRERAAAGKSDLPAGIQPSCVAIATPACATQDLASGCADYVTTLVCQIFANPKVEARSSVQNDLVPRACLYGFEQLRQEVIATDWQSDLAKKFVADEVAGFASSTSALIAQQYRTAAELLTGKDARTAKAIGILGSAWESLSENASKHSASARQLLSKTSLRVALLPATPDAQQSPDRSPAADRDDADLRPPGLLARLAAVALQIWRSRLPTHEAADAAGPGSSVGKKSTVGFSLAADDWWESSRVISGRHHIEPPSDGVVVPAGDATEAAARLRRRAAFWRMGVDLDKIAESYGLEPLEKTGSQKVDSPQMHGLASDGDVDAELKQVLTDIGEAGSSGTSDFSVAPQMVAPGKLIYLQRTGDEGDSSYEAVEADEGQTLRRIILSKSMITDHLCSTYMSALESVMQRLERGQARRRIE